MKKILILLLICFNTLAFSTSDFKVYLVNQTYDKISIDSNLHWYLLTSFTDCDNWPGQIKTKLDINKDICVLPDEINPENHVWLTLSEDLIKETQGYGTSIESSIIIGSTDTLSVKNRQNRRTYPFSPIKGLPPPALEKLTIGLDFKLLSSKTKKVNLFITGEAVVEDFKLDHKNVNILVNYVDEHDSLKVTQNLTPQINTESLVKENATVAYTAFMDDDELEDFILKVNGTYFLFLSNKMNLNDKIIYTLEEQWEEGINY